MDWKTLSVGATWLLPPDWKSPNSDGLWLELWPPPMVLCFAARSEQRGRACVKLRVVTCQKEYRFTTGTHRINWKIVSTYDTSCLPQDVCNRNKLED
eukprot:5202386-Pyramimonas_sp.AAC.1